MTSTATSRPTGPAPRRPGLSDALRPDRRGRPALLRLAAEHRPGYDLDAHAPTGPVDLDPVHPVDPDPVDSSGPVDSVLVDPAAAVDPGEPVDPVDSSGPVDSDLAAPAAPVDAGELVDPRGAAVPDHDLSGPAQRPADPCDATVPSLRDVVGDALRAMRRALDVVTTDGATGGGEVGALLDLVSALDTGHAVAVEVTRRIEAGGLAEQRMGLPLENVLAMRSSWTFGDRRTLVNVATVLRGLPNIRAAFHAGALGWAQVRSIVCEVQPLSVEARLDLDARFEDLGRLGRMDPDQVIDAVRDAVGRLRADLATDRSLRTIEARFLHVQPALDGALTGYFELDAEAGTTFLAGLEAAMPPPSAGPKDVTRDAIGEGDPDVDDLDETGPDGQPGWVDPVERRSRARQRADGLVMLAEQFLAGNDATAEGGRPRRARVRMNVVADIATLTGNDTTAFSARLLWQTIGAPPVLTPAATRRLASDADLRFLLTDGGEILGVAAPTPAIPAKVRVAVQVRDRGCRFPGCSIPMAWTDLHHVIAREDGGPTVVTNLVALCRRHHVAVTEGRWRLTMTHDAVVTVRRGRHLATSDPPALRELDPPGNTSSNATT